MEKRLCKVNISSAGGTASAGSKTYKITLPSKWLMKMGVSDIDRQLELSFDGERIVVSRYMTVDEFKEHVDAKGHSLMILRYYDADILCTTIYIDNDAKEIRISNHTKDVVKTAFGTNEYPTWNEYLEFIEERCIPRGRAGLREYLETIGVDEYDPLEIIKRTEGRMAEDQQWLKIEV